METVTVPTTKAGYRPNGLDTRKRLSYSSHRTLGLGSQKTWGVMHSAYV